MRPAHRLDFADVGKQLRPETGSQGRDEDLEAQPGPGCHDRLAKCADKKSKDRLPFVLLCALPNDLVALVIRGTSFS